MTNSSMCCMEFMAVPGLSDEPSVLAKEDVGDGEWFARGRGSGIRDVSEEKFLKASLIWLT